MNNNQQFLITCGNCRKQQPHFVIKVSLKRGVKLSCSKCGTTKKSYHKIQNLHPYEPITPETENNRFNLIENDCMHEPTEVLE